MLKTNLLISLAVLTILPVTPLFVRAMPAPQTRLALSTAQVANIAEQISVRIDGQAPGSGVLLSRQGQTYFVLTAAHVVATPDEYEVITPDGQKYKINYAQVKKLQGVDLAVVQFTSARTYTLAKLGNSSQAQRGTAAFVAGWPASGNAITNPTLLFQQGIISANSQVQQADGYGLIYTNNTLPGMSGGPVLNNKGELIGIHGKGETERQQGTQNTGVVVKVGYNLGVPINTFLNLAPRAGINLPLGTPVTAIAAAPPATSATRRIDDFIAEGSNRLHRGDYPGAIAALDRAIATDPTAADARRMRAVARLSALGWSKEAVQAKSNRPAVDAASQDLDESIRLDPNASESFALRGALRAALDGRSAGALEDVNNALRLAPNSGAAYVARASVRGNRGDYRGALEDATEAIQRDPNSFYTPMAYSIRGTAKARLNDLAGGLRDQTQAIQLSPKYAVAYINRGQMRVLMGDNQGGLADLQRGADLAIEQNNTELHRETIKLIQAARLRQRLGL
jgi:S1-C subfamily serine protease/regulator of sirC expression with transglutaminase-like and TPR domain